MAYFWSPWHEIAMAFALVLLAISAPSHFHSRNTGTILFICWTFLANAIILINRLIWHDHVRNLAPIWCDISTKLLIGFNVAIGSASIVINRRLYKISRISTVIVTPAQKRKELIIDLSIGLGIPALIMCLHYIVQGHRANIIQGIGCWPTIYNVPPAYPIYFMWPCLLSVIAIIYGMLSLRAFIRRRNSVEEFLTSNASGLNADRYMRLMCFSSVELVVAFPLTLFELLSNIIDTPMFPWISWEDTHFMFDRFDQVPAIIIEQSTLTTIYVGIALWIVPILAYIFFIFFGLGREQINQYKRWYYAALKPFGVKPPAPRPYNPDRRTWWQKLFRLRGPTGHGISSRGMTDSVPTFRHGAPQVGSYGEKPIPSARSRIPTVSMDVTLTLDLDHDDEKVDLESDIVEELPADFDVNKALPASPTVVVNSSRERVDDDDEKYSRTSRLTASSASSVAGSSRRVSAAIRDVELSEAEIRAIEARVQRMV